MENTTMPATKSMLIGLFVDKDNAEKAYEDLKDSGYTADEINIVMAKEPRERLYGDKDEAAKTEIGNKALEGAGAGGAIGGVIGGIVGAIAAMGTNLLIPGLGFVILGPLAAGLAGAGAGGLTGGIIGALVGAGVPKEKAAIYNEGLNNGKILLSVHPHNMEDTQRLAEKWREYQAEDVHSE